MHRVRCLPQIAGKRLFSKKRMVDKRLSVWFVEGAETFEEWAVVGGVMVLISRT